MSSELLAPLDLAFWHLESPAHPLHLGALAHFGPLPATAGQEPADVLGLLARRAAAVPRLRMRVRDVLLPVGGSAWAADPDFDVRRHVHEVALPGADFPAEAARLAAELMERPVARGLPPWEMYLLSGAPDGSFAVLVKLHHALADGMRAVAIGAGIFDEIAAGRRPASRQRPVPPRSWLPGPGRLLGMARDRIGDLGRAVEVGASVVGASVVRAGRLDGRPALAAESSGTRRIATVTLPLDRVHRIRRATGGTANDVLLALVAGALRRWFDGRGLPFPGADPRALVPVSRRRPGTPPGPGNSLSGYLLDLPVTEPEPAARLAAVRAAMDRNKAAGPFRGAGAVALLADRLPPLAHRFGAPLASGAARLLFDLLVTQVPLPRSALSLGGAPLRALFPMAPLARGQSLAVAMSPYGGQVHIGLVADGEAVPDLDALATALTAELDLLDPPTS
ncbi:MULTISPECIES: wax ester/triacylglycerol synthase family O-acyltransferase [unclassified Streptomyces]|uniref:wax ester/triacylglycerol synthase family O-acyltransferase n=1 Tax=unclassified Streptomyces TaxID=2593676 RepID=UPI00070207F4|nr:MULTISPECIES: wax ester/triacylglycerol synthase family O-acyltransferase [unclassified Streptomyces]KQX50633.1 diacylglycerol O-acyltransferase [Streptomyces sp. Root1304]KRA84797.1 diacylglycerol O-acyltransferase [Streptomyces sp. Root66D1]